MINFSTVKDITIPEGKVKSIEVGGITIWKKSRLPHEYQEVAYIESTGTQYINTGVQLTSDHSVELDYQFVVLPQLNERKGLFGGLANGGRFGSLVSPTTNKLEYGYGTGNAYYQTTVPDTNRHLIKQEKNEVYVDGTLIHIFAEVTFSMTTNAFLGNFNYTNYTPSLAKYYSSKWYDGNGMVRNFIPCYRKSDGEVGMYDLVSKEFFTNKGTGTFKKGSNL